ncbi:VOC family protein [Tateyamaria sp. ANG-S1]|uniref:VOC family protein n=1 Tax=Tateyamaria sp. ANG-S1 TaxID=1577905 RepID=UPI00057D71F2|nr:VOC family protein [Tateyamaria sp. ANG-S1]KIC49609.1 glyoxalase [Tateyamaria sp. ANG-S1]
MSPPLSSLVLYTSRMEEMAQFYTDHFGYTAHIQDGDRVVELHPPGDGITLLLHQMGKGRKQGQVLVKLVFAIEDVAAFCDAASTKGLEFGSLHKADGYVFANAKDPAGNSISVSGRLA